ncbi:aminotransferase class IV [Parapedobacter tibetensis]|uniref:aminotransferase class IV n=1 Tax=Parapedobacter tibetensis TaxID=2972951 RepID=UPI00214DEADC|nr:aminotransferase class IV [Parapedobacter tibetensis]
MRKSYPKEVFLNGQWLPHDQATVSVFDRGFMLGDGIYEVIPFYQNKLFTPDEHIQRLKAGLAEVGIAYDVDSLKTTASEAVVRAGCNEGAVYIQITRGAAPRTHYFPADVEPTVLLYAFHLSLGGFEQKLVDVILSEDFRWHRCNIKSISLIANVLANNFAHQQGVLENVLIRNGLVTEGSCTSVFFVRNGIVYTHPEGPHILPGITRNLVILLCGEMGIEVEEKAISVNDLPFGDEAFLTGTTMQVTAIGSMRIGSEQLVVSTDVGQVTRRIQQAFIKRIEAL